MDPDRAGRQYSNISHGYHTRDDISVNFSVPLVVYEVSSLASGAEMRTSSENQSKKQSRCVLGGSLSMPNSLIMHGSEKSPLTCPFQPFYHLSNHEENNTEPGKLHTNLQAHL